MIISGVPAVALVAVAAALIVNVDAVRDVGAIVTMAPAGMPVPQTGLPTAISFAEYAPRCVTRPLGI